MKKYFSIIGIAMMLFTAAPVYCLSFGSYNTETEYGLIDGFNWNWSRKDKSQKFLEVKEPRSKEEQDKEKNLYPEDIYLKNLIENRPLI